MAQIESPPRQHQERQPGADDKMTPRPDYAPREEGGYRLLDKVALIPGGDSGIGRATAIAFAREGARIALVYLNEENDAEATRGLVEKEGRECLVIPGDVGDPETCKRAVAETLKRYGRIDVLVNNAGEQHPQPSITDIPPEQLERTFRTNVFGYFFMIQATLPHLKEGSSIINIASVTAYKGNPTLVDYSATKGAIVALTRALALQLADKNIRVNAVAPGPIWTPLIPSTFEPEQVERFGKNTPLGRVGQPNEVAPSLVFLACSDASYMTGQVLHPNGGSVVNA